MKSTRLATLCAALGLASFLHSSSFADTYTDASGETINSAGGTIDLIGAEVTHDATDVTFKLTVNGNIQASSGGVDWGKFLVGIANGKGGASGGTKTGNGWGRPINLDAGANGGMTHWIGSWVDGGGGSQLWQYSGGAWNQLAGSANHTFTPGATSVLQFKVSRATLGVATGDTIYFDAYSSGGGGTDGAIDALAKPTQSIANWGDTHTSVAPNLYSYTLTAPLDFDGDNIPDVTDTDDDNDGLLDTVETGTGIWVSASDTGTNSKNADTDGDGLNDGVETNTGIYVGVLDTGSNPLVSDDFDRDLLPDFHDTDDDNDTLADTVETGTNIWVSSSDTGTNAKDDDTDNDGLKDGVETNSGSYSSATDTGTNPHVADQALVILAGNSVLFPSGAFEAGNTNNRLFPTVGGPYNVKSITRFIGSPTNNIEFKFTGGSWDLNWGIGSNGVTALNTNTGAISGTLFKDKTPTADDRTINVNIGRARGEYVFTFNDASNSLAFSVTRKNYADLAEYAAAYGLTAANAEGTADPDGDTLNNQAEFTANTAPDSMDTDGDGLNDNDETAGTYGFATNPTLPDSDGDGLRDLWELQNNLNPTVATGNDGADGDPDNDGSPNILEQANGTDPNAAGTGFSSPYAKITIPGSFTGWNVNGNWENTMKLVGNNSWRALIFVSTNTMAATNQFKFAPASYTGSWGRGPSANVAVQNASENLLTTVLNTNGYYRFDFNDFSGVFSVTALSGGADADADGLPDAYEAWYGGQLTPAVTDLDPASDPDGDGSTTAQEFASGSNPVLDVAVPVITLVGDETLVLALNGTYVDPGVTVTDDRTNTVTVTTNTTQLNPALKGIYPVTYVATDAAGNSTTNNQRFVVVGDWTDGYPSPIYYNLQILNSGLAFNRAVTNNQASTFEVYAQYYRRGATEGTNRTDAKASCWIGVTTNTNSNATNDLTTDWTWTAATLNAGNNGGNDEYKVTYTNLAPGTYQVLSRWQFDGGVYGYGGLNEDNQGGALGLTVPKTVGTGTNAITNQIAYLPGSITVTAVSVGYAKIQFPTAPAPISVGESFDVYFQFYSAGVTEAAGAPTWAGVQAQLGYSLAGGDPSVVGAYTWVNATFNAQMPAPDANNDEYKGTLTGLAAGTYSYAVRFSVDGGATWVYGGTNGIWSNDSGTLVVNKATPTITAAPTASAITAGQALSASILNGGTAGVPGTFAWTDGTTVPNATGSYGVTFIPTDAANYNTATTTVSVTVNPASGLDLNTWLAGQTMSPAVLGKLAIGGASSATANDGEKPVVSVSGGQLVLSAIVRTNGPAGLAVIGEAVSSLADYGTPASITSVNGEPAAVQGTVPDGCQRQEFKVNQDGGRKFLRLRATLP